MEATILTELFGVDEGYELERAEHTEDCLRLHLRVRRDRFRCPTCGSAAVSRKGRRRRVLQTVPVGLTAVYLHTEVPDCACRDCGARFELSPLLPRPIAGSPIDWWRSCRPSRG